MSCCCPISFQTPQWPVPPIPVVSPGVASGGETEIEVTNAGNVAAGMQSIAIINIGTSSGTITFAGSTAIQILPNQTKTVSAYFDPVTNTFNRIGAIDYDATGTTFQILTKA